MITLTLNDKKIKSPACYEELGTGRFERVFKEWDMSNTDITKRDYFHLFNILSDTKFTSFSPTPENEVTIWNCIKWYIEQPYEFPVEIPKVLQIGDKVIDLPESIGELGIGQNIYLRQAIHKSKYIQENISLAVATYLQPIYDNAKFDSKRVKELQEVIKEMPIHLTYPVGFFLLTRAIESGWKPLRTWQQIRNNLKQSLKKTWREWRRFQGSPDSMTYP
jgi:hypothetical protein